MSNRPLIVLLGDSLLMDGVAVGLAEQQIPHPVRLDAEVHDFRGCLKSLSPDLIVFELDNPRSPTILSLLREEPGILLIGLDPECSRVIVLNSQQEITRSMKDLCQVVQAAAGLQATPSKGGAATGNNPELRMLT